MVKDKYKITSKDIHKIAFVFYKPPEVMFNRNMLNPANWGK